METVENGVLLTVESGDVYLFIFSSNKLFLNTEDVPRAALGLQDDGTDKGLSCQIRLWQEGGVRKWTVCLGDSVASKGGWHCATCTFKRQASWEMLRLMQITASCRVAG